MMRYTENDLSVEKCQEGIGDLHQTQSTSKQSCLHKLLDIDGCKDRDKPTLESRALYLESHEWVSVEENLGTVGITEYARRELGEIVYIDFPAIGQVIQKGDPVCVLESTKAAVDVYAPVSGQIIAVNSSFLSSPEGSWLFQVALAFPEELETLLSIEEYRKLHLL